MECVKYHVHYFKNKLHRKFRNSLEEKKIGRSSACI